jgi:endoglucanase
LSPRLKCAVVSALVAATLVLPFATAPAAATVEALEPEAVEPAPAWLAAAWSAYRDRFVVQGRVVDNVNGISHSEGQGYAMLIAVRADDEPGFRELWGWTKRELMVRGDRLAAWRWEEKAKPRVTDPNNATDGDLLIAWALIEAAERWRDRGFADAARAILTDIGRLAVDRSPFGLVLRPGVAGFAAEDRPDGPVVNLSYWVFPAFPRLRGLAPEIDWAQIEATGLRLIRNSRFGIMRLPSDWVSIRGGAPQPAQGFPVRFSYNAIRIPLYLAWAKAGRRDDLRIFSGLWNEVADAGPFEIDLTTGSAVETFGGLGFKAVAALVHCALQGRKLSPALRAVPIENYYATTLHLLTLIAVQERYPECL